MVTTCAADVPPSGGPEIIEVGSSKGFVVGKSLVIDVADERGVQESTVLMDIIDDTHILIDKTQFAHKGTLNAFPVIQPGTKGTLIAEWNEFTPTSATDIAVTSPLPDMT